MKIYDYSNIKKLYVIGDIHGDFEPFFNVIKKYYVYTLQVRNWNRSEFAFYLTHSAMSKNFPR